MDTDKFSGTNEFVALVYSCYAVGMVEAEKTCVVRVPVSCASKCGISTFMPALPHPTA